MFSMVNKFHLFNFSVFLLYQFSFTEAVRIKVHSCQKKELDHCGIRHIYVDPGERIYQDDDTIYVDSGANVTVSFDFMPLFTTRNLRWKILEVGMFGDYPMKGIDEAGCNYTHCPIVPRKNNHFSAPVHIPTWLKSKKYVIKIMLTNGDITSENCCFLTNVLLQKPLTTPAVNSSNTTSGQTYNVTYKDESTTATVIGYFSFLKNKFNSWIGEKFWNTENNQSAAPNATVIGNESVVDNQMVANNETILSNDPTVGNKTNVDYETIILGNETETVTENVTQDITYEEIEASQTNSTTKITSPSVTTIQKEATTKKETVSLKETKKEEPTVTSITVTKTTISKPRTTHQTTTPHETPAKEKPTAPTVPGTGTTISTSTEPSTTFTITHEETPIKNEKRTVGNTTTKEATTVPATTHKITQKETPAKKKPTTAKPTTAKSTT